MPNTKNARLCRHCNTQPCPYPNDEDFRLQREAGGQEWLEAKPCWTPIPGNIGKVHDEKGNFLDEQGGGELMEKPAFQSSYLADLDEDNPYRMKIEGIANEVLSVLLKENLSHEEAKEVLLVAREFVGQCKVTTPSHQV